ncbi:sugar ABC transporter substrate-binding protein [Homoserinibacter sp. YIM 151385]|uniref:sugar ABC transporter substrate-binding protein n=1 Tax=Homoserinibacter sp. YIM 151385 TaxID=2985506 RepID=UPI0022F0F1B8|nr:sugar ABC transporter substrate-binding protein [Homoserinibacter sp. YIM 151385]WBU37469.1 sugar ABC transporter substrate-binding protein [Homoserinibacter sp. YIM 151385]
MKRILGGAVALVAAVALAACSSGATPGETTGDDGEKTLGIVAYIGNNAINQQAIRGATTVAEENGWTVKVTDTQGSADEANATMSSYANQGVDGILVLVFASTAIGQGLQAAKAAGVPVISWGGGEADGIVATTSNEAVGKASADALVEEMGDEGDLLALTFHPGKLCLDHQNEFDAAVAETELDITYNEVVVPGQQQSATNFTAAWLTNHPEGQGNYGIWTCWDEPMEGITAALKQAGRTDVKTFSTNGSAPGILDVQSGEVTSVVWQPSEDEGAALMETLIEAIEAGDSWEPEVLKIDGVVVDASNVDDFIAEHPDAVQ